MRYVALGLLAVVPLSAAFASELPDEPQAIVSSPTPIEAFETSSLGYRINDASGFQLIEHGHWKAGFQSEAAEQSANEGNQAGQLQTSPQLKPKNVRQISDERLFFHTSMPPKPGLDYPQGYSMR